MTLSRDADAARLYGLNTQNDPWRASPLARRTDGDDNGLLAALQPVERMQFFDARYMAHEAEVVGADVESLDQELGSCRGDRFLGCSEASGLTPLYVSTLWFFSLLNRRLLGPLGPLLIRALRKGGGAVLTLSNR
jgi:hypothetical protein